MSLFWFVIFFFVLLILVLIVYISFVKAFYWGDKKEPPKKN